MIQRVGRLHFNILFIANRLILPVFFFAEILSTYMLGSLWVMDVLKGPCQRACVSAKTIMIWIIPLDLFLLQ